MRRARLSWGLLGAVVVLSVAASSSEAGWLRWRYMEPVPVQVTSTTSAPATTAAAETVAAPHVLPVSSAMAAPMPSDALAPPAAYYPATPAYCPTGSSSGWSTTPRSSWDFGKFPPYYR
jgi:hypothetical protein